MALALRSATSAFASSASPSITIPAGTQAGDLMIIVTAGGWTPSSTPPTGWSLVSAAQGNFWQWAAYSKVAPGTLGSTSTDAGKSVTLSYSNSFDVQTALYVVSGGVSTPVISSVFSNASTAGTINATAAAGDLFLYYGSARPNSPVTVTLSSGITDATRSADANSGSVLGHDSPVAGAVSQTFTPSTAGGGSTGRAYVAIQLSLVFDDTFANARAVSSPYSTTGVDTTGWTTEVGEPGSASHTGWLTFTPSTTDQYTLSTVGSSFDTIVSVYTGTALNNLVLVGSDDDSGGSGTSKLELILTASTTYYIQVGAQPAGSGGLLAFSLAEMADARLATDYVEVLDTNTTTTQRRLATSYVESLDTNNTTTQRTIATVYVEVLVPSAPGFIGWGLPL